MDAAIKTPYLANGRFDLDAYDRMVEHQIANGVDVGWGLGGSNPWPRQWAKHCGRAWAGVVPLQLKVCTWQEAPAPGSRVSK